ncbi:MAG: pitrilysin family protein [Candidatus Peribacteraceae bacterium]|jgi:predicted Zn-dependent peptidase
MYNLSTLPSGLPILTAPSDGTDSVTVLMFAGAGSRYEREEERGISHFLEHMFFKGGKRYPSTKDVSVAIDSVGGDFNAFTGKEYAGYYVKVAAQHLDLACDVLSDMLLCASFPKEDIERERGVIIEEERMYQDTPMYRAGWDFEQLIFGDHPLGWDTIGKEKVILSVQQKDFQAHKDLLYTPDNLVLAFAGKVTTDQAMNMAETYFPGIDGAKQREFAAFSSYGSERVFLRTKKTEQAHLVLGVPGVNVLDDDHFAHKLLSIILGGNMSSRMFLNIREAKGLCYYISTETDSYMDAGVLSTRAGVDQSRLHEAITAIKNEYMECAAHGVTEEEVQRAKDFLKGKITLSLEDSEERAHFFGKQELLYPKTRTIEEYFVEIDKVTKEQIDTLATRLLSLNELRLVVIGQEKEQDKLEALISA